MGNNTEQSFPFFNFIHNRGAEGRWSSDSFKLNGPLPPLLTANYQCYTWLIIAHVTVLLRESQVLQMRSSLRNRLRILSCYTWALIRKIPSKWSPLISISNILYFYFYPALSRMSWVMAQHSHTLFCILSLYSFVIYIHYLQNKWLTNWRDISVWSMVSGLGQGTGARWPGGGQSNIGRQVTSGQKEEGNTTQIRSRFTRKRNLTVQLFRYGSSVLIKHHIYLSGFVIELNCVPSQQQNRQFLIHDFISQGDDVAGHRPRQQ